MIGYRLLYSSSVFSSCTRRCHFCFRSSKRRRISSNFSLSRRSDPLSFLSSSNGGCIRHQRVSTMVAGLGRPTDRGLLKVFPLRLDFSKPLPELLQVCEDSGVLSGCQESQQGA